MRAAERGARVSRRRARVAFALLLSAPVVGASAAVGDAGGRNTTALLTFVLFVISTLCITWWAARRTRSRKEFYIAGGGISAWQNGIAIAGDFMSAATFLGLSSLLYFSGVDGLMLAAGAVASWPIILFLVAERMRNLGRYTFIDVVSLRLAARPVTLVAALGSLSTAVFYLISQLVGAGKLVQLLFGIDYVWAVVCVSSLMILYVTFGGMLATTWVQIIKAFLLVVGGTIIALLMLPHFSFDLGRVFQGAVSVHPQGAQLMAPGGWLTDPVSVISLGLTCMLGFIGLPHVLMRIFTVKDARTARHSTFYAVSIIGYFNLLMIVIGFGAISLIMFNSDYHDAAGLLAGGRNMVVLHVSHYLGGDILLGFTSAVAFATILAVVSGLTISAAATIAHDLYAKSIKQGKATEKSELLVSRCAVIAIGILAILFGIAFESLNVIFITNMALAVAGSANAPILLLSMYWRDLTTRGAIYGCLAGLLSSVSLIILGPQVWVDVIGMERALFPYTYPTVVSAPLAFVTAWLCSKTDNSARAAQERAAFDAQYIRSELGVSVAAPAEH